MRESTKRPQATRLVFRLVIIALNCVCGYAAELNTEVRTFKGLPQLFINGKLSSSLIGYSQSGKDYQDLLKAGITVADINAPFEWLGPEKYDFTPADKIFEEYIKLDPRAQFLPRISAVPGDWWCTAFPEEISKHPNGKPAGTMGEACRPSFASATYRRMARRTLEAFAAHLESRYGDRIIGYFPCNGIYGEWFSWNAYWEVRPGSPPPTEFGVEDYSAPALTAFRNWLRRKYIGSVGDFRRAWGDSRVTFDTAKIPDEAARKKTTHGIFFDPAVSRQVPDYFEFYNDLVSDVLVEQCHIVKEATGRKKIVGVFYGYLWSNWPHLSHNHAGHLGFEKVLVSPDVDFIASPYSYDNRAVGGPDTSQTLPESIASHGKLYFNEVDTETHLHQRQWRWGDSLRNPRNFEETRGLLLRDFGYAFTRGSGMWYMDLLGGMFHDPAITQLLSDIKGVDEKYLDADKRSVPDIAVILDEDSFRYFGDGEVLFTALLSAQKQWELGFLGAPFDCYRLRDLMESGVPDHRLYILLNAFRVTPAERAVLHARFKRNSATAVWVYAPGYIGENGLSLSHMQSLTGIRLAEDDSPGELHVEVTNFEHACTKDVPKGLSYGTDVNVEAIKATFDHHLYLKDPSDPSLRRDLAGFRITPRFFSDDPEVTVLGQLAGLNKPGLVVKSQKGWMSVYSSAPILPAALLRNIARAAGCHIYSDAGDVVYANKRFICIYAPHGGRRVIHLRRPGIVLDAFDNSMLSSGSADFALSMEANSARLMVLQ